MGPQGPTRIMPGQEGRLGREGDLPTATFTRRGGGLGVFRGHPCLTAQPLPHYPPDASLWGLCLPHPRVQREVSSLR